MTIETEIKLVRRMFYGQKVSISKFKFSLSSLVLYCYLHLTSHLFDSRRPTAIIKHLKHIREESHVYVYYGNAIISYATFLYLV